MKLRSSMDNENEMEGGNTMETTSKLTQEQIDELVQRGKAQNGVLTYGDVMGTINSLETVSSEEVEHL